MNKVLKKKWVKALRSGEYKQGRSVLRAGKGKDAKYCCLGVLCRVAGERIPRGATFPSIKHQLEFGLCDKEEYETLREDYALESRVAKRLAKWNDGIGPAPGKSFKQIAAWIERYL